jgi:hypothetical protein
MPGRSKEFNNSRGFVKILLRQRNLRHPFCKMARPGLFVVQTSGSPRSYRGKTMKFLRPASRIFGVTSRPQSRSWQKTLEALPYKAIFAPWLIFGQ